MFSASPKEGGRAYRALRWRALRARRRVRFHAIRAHRRLRRLGRHPRLQLRGGVGIQVRQRTRQLLADARALRDASELDAALDAAQAALKLRPGWRDAIRVLLTIHGARDDAAGFERTARALEPLDELSEMELRRLAANALRAGAPVTAQRAATILLARTRGHHAASVALAIARWEQHDEAGAATVVHEAIARNEQDGLLIALDLHHHTDDLDAALPIFGRLADPSPSLLRSWALAYLKRGEPEFAAQLTNMLRARDPSHPDIPMLEERASQLRAVVNGTWAPVVPAESIEPVPGRTLHLVGGSLPHHTSGGTYRTHYLTTSQRSVGIDSHVVTQIGFPWRLGVETDSEMDVVDGVEYRRIRDIQPERASQDQLLLRNLQALVPLVRELRPTVLHPHSDYFNALLALRLREIFGVPVVYEVRGFPEARLVRRKGSRAWRDHFVGRRRIELECMLAADHVVTIADVMRDHMVSRGIAAEKISVVPNGVDPRLLRPQPRDLELAQRLGIRDGEVVLGYVSTFHGYEGIGYVIDAVARLRASGRPARALLVGDGNDRVALERRAQDHGVATAVSFAGRVPHSEVPAYYALIDIFVVPRRDEATTRLVTPLKPFEAMAMRRPVIASDVAALREIVTDGVTGRVFRADDPEDLAAVAMELIDDPSQRGRLAEAGFEWVTAERSWERNAKSYHAIYERVTAA